MSRRTKGEPFTVARTLPFRRIVPPLVRDPVKALGEIAAEADGEIVRLNLGTFRPYLVTHPDHVQQVLRGNAANYVRGGAFWKPLRRLFGSSIMSDGDLWHSSRNALQPLFTAKHIDSLAEIIADTVADAIDDLSRRTGDGATVDASAELSLIVSRTVAKIFFGDRISTEESERLIPALNMIATSIVSRIMLPLVPGRVPLPGDRAFNEAVAAFDDVMIPLVARHPPGPGSHDVYSALRRARDADPSLPDSWVRDNLVAIFATGSETAIMQLTWLWPMLDSHPGVAARLREEIDQVVGDDRIRPSHLPGLVYTKMVLQELLRLYPVGWMFSRMAVERDTLGGVTIEPGAEVMISPYLTHRLESVWDRPLVFDPERFAPGATGRHRYAYFPFGGGPHTCMGMHLFTMEAQLVIAGMLSRFEPSLATSMSVTPRAAVTLRPRANVMMTLRPAGRAG
ncbi:cytochrome P450 [Streptosporangium soli]|nr:cytochrome P450 [Streptosporangium sp. KLBMP 9127]